MPSYTYRALTQQGSDFKGEAVAVSRKALEQQLVQSGLLVISIRPRAGDRLLFSFRRRVTGEAFFLLVQEMEAMLRAGIPLSEVLSQVRYRPGQRLLEQGLSKLTADVKQGAALSQAAADQPEIFDPVFVAAAKTGELTGDLAGALSFYNAALRKRIQFERKLTQALAYPVFLGCVLAFVMAVLFLFVLPRFAEVYADAEVRLPIATQWLIDVVEYLPAMLSGIGGGVIALGLLVRRLKTTEQGRIQLYKIIRKVPWVGALVDMHGMAQMGAVLSALLQSGMPLDSALEATAEAIRDRARAQRLLSVAKSVREGGRLADALMSEGLVEPAGGRMVAAGESAGDLAKAFRQATEFFEERFDSKVSKVAALMEPVLMLTIGVIVGVVIVVMYLPIFGMTELVL